jgi:hypothetical protein
MGQSSSQFRAAALYWFTHMSRGPRKREPLTYPALATPDQHPSVSGAMFCTLVWDLRASLATIMHKMGTFFKARRAPVHPIVAEPLSLQLCLAPNESMTIPIGQEWQRSHLADALLQRVGRGSQQTGTVESANTATALRQPKPSLSKGPRPGQTITSSRLLMGWILAAGFTRMA